MYCTLTNSYKTLEAYTAAAPLTRPTRYDGGGDGNGGFGLLPPCTPCTPFTSFSALYRFSLLMGTSVAAPSGTLPTMRAGAPPMTLTGGRRVALRDVRERRGR